MLNNPNINSITNDYAVSLSGGSGGSVPSNNNSLGLDSTNNGAISANNSSWITSHSNMNHNNNNLAASSNKISVSSAAASGHWNHSTSPAAAASCMNNMLDTNGFQSSSAHMAPSITSQSSTDPFGYVTAAAHANDLTKSSFFYASQFGGGIRGLSL